MIKNKIGQVTIFVIIAIVILIGVGLYFYVKSNTSQPVIPSDFKPVEETFLSCIQDYVHNGISMMEESGGWIYLPKFEPGSAYMPSSNMLDLSGFGVPYWYYVSGNNVAKEQMPSKQQMEQQLKKYLEENVVCDFSSYGNKGYTISLAPIKVEVSILDTSVSVKLTSNLDISLGGKSIRISKHDQNVNSKLGEFYNTAVQIYNNEKQSAFLEKYGVDALYNYAPVTGVEMSCSPKIWNINDVKTNIENGLEANIAMLKVNGNYYDKSKVNSYFIGNINSNDAVQFLYSSSWPTKIETQDQNGFLIAQPVGNQPGLGVLGFCYIPIHFVYNLVYPVLIQIYDNNEIFRFPVVAVIQGNKERGSIESGNYSGDVSTPLCQYKNAQVSVSTYNTNLNPVEAEISFECFGERCDIGKTKLSGGAASLDAFMPSCVNGYIIATADNYKEKRQLISTNTESTANIILDKLYNVSLNLKIDNADTTDSALIYFEGSAYSTSVVWPDQKNVELADDLYNITVYAYRNGSITIPGTNQEKCINVPKPGLLGMFGATTEQCFPLNIPEQIVSNVISGGGKSQIYLAESDLVKGSADVLVPGVKVPSNVQDLQSSYDSLNNNQISIEFKS